MVSLCLGASENPARSHVGRTVVVAAPADVVVTVTVEAVDAVGTVAWEETGWSESVQAALNNSPIAIANVEITCA